MPRALLSADLRREDCREAQATRGAEEGEACGRQEEDVERRRTPRLAGLVPGPGLGGGYWVSCTYHVSESWCAGTPGEVPGCRVWCRVAVLTVTVTVT